MLIMQVSECSWCLYQADVEVFKVFVSGRYVSVPGVFCLAGVGVSHRC